MHLFCIFVFEGCGVTLDPEDTPYLEILCVRDPRDEESMMETKDRDRERREGDIKSRGDPQEISVEKQNSLITLAWSKPAHAENYIQVHTHKHMHSFYLKSAPIVHSYIKRLISAGSDLGSERRGRLNCNAGGFS